MIRKLLFSYLQMQPTYHFQQPQQFIQTRHFSHVTSASGLNTEPKKIARVQPQIQSQQPARSISSTPAASATPLSASSSSLPHPSASTGTGIRQDKVDPMKALASMARTPMTSTAQDNQSSLSISHSRPPPLAPKTMTPTSDANFKPFEDSKPFVTVTQHYPPRTSDSSPNDRQRSVGIQAKIGGPLKILTPRPWKGSTTPAPPSISASSTPAPPLLGSQNYM